MVEYLATLLDDDHDVSYSTEGRLMLIAHPEFEDEYEAYLHIGSMPKREVNDGSG